jgi:hypothetical protein
MSSGVLSETHSVMLIPRGETFLPKATRKPFTKSIPVCGLDSGTEPPEVPTGVPSPHTTRQIEVL